MPESGDQVTNRVTIDSVKSLLLLSITVSKLSMEENEEDNEARQHPLVRR